MDTGMKWRWTALIVYLAICVFDFMIVPIWFGIMRPDYHMFLNEVDSGHEVDLLQRYGDHTSTINLTNSCGAYNLDVDQIDQSTDRSYSITGYCTNPSGCTVSVTQN